MPAGFGGRETIVSGATTGFLSGVSDGMTVIDMSTISPTTTEELATEIAEKGASMLDAPISGGEIGAIEGTLSIMVGGDEAVFDEQRDLFEVMGETVTHCGPNGAGQTTKACNQIVVSAQMVGVSEALVFAEKAGADLEAVVEAISGGAAGCWTLDNRASRMIEGNFDPGFFASYQYKDLRIATDAGQAFGVPSRKRRSHTNCTNRWKPPDGSRRQLGRDANHRRPRRNGSTCRLIGHYRPGFRNRLLPKTVLRAVRPHENPNDNTRVRHDSKTTR